MDTLCMAAWASHGSGLAIFARKGREIAQGKDRFCPSTAWNVDFHPELSRHFHREVSHL
jgi:hypothetical protein